MSDELGSFRDSIGTINEEGKRNFLHPKKPSGSLTKKRSLVAMGLLVLLFSIPWIRINDQPLLMLNVIERKFVLFGNIFWPQDFYLLAISMIIGVLFVVLFTVVFGRLFCGWVCPQTIFLEHVFRRIEYWIDGDRGQQIRLSKLPWNHPEKLRNRILKNLIFWVISFLIANDFMMVIVGTDNWLLVVTDGPLAHLGNFIGIIIFTTIFYFVFSWFREQVCIIVCPYGRLQGAMLDRNSIVIAYDYLRGENRGKFKKSENRKESGKGDCIDCNQCVDVCPTGIDIRNGTQLECINCTACIDACDAMMDKVNLPKGLIRYASEEEIAESKPRKFTTRAKAYTAVLTILIITMGFLLSKRPTLDATILRAQGLTYQTREGDLITNLFTFSVINKSTDTVQYDIVLLNPEKGQIEFIGNPNKTIGTSEKSDGTFFLILQKSDLTGSKTDVELGIMKGNELVEKIHTNFNGPRVHTKK